MGEQQSAPAKRGRPALESAERRSVRLAVRLSTKEYDAACRRAESARVSVGELVRRAMRRPE